MTINKKRLEKRIIKTYDRLKHIEQVLKSNNLIKKDYVFFNQKYQKLIKHYNFLAKVYNRNLNKKGFKNYN